jgi:hypothetical protein
MQDGGVLTLGVVFVVCYPGKKTWGQTRRRPAPPNKCVRIRIKRRWNGRSLPANAAPAAVFMLSRVPREHAPLKRRRHAHLQEEEEEEEEEVSHVPSETHCPRHVASCETEQNGHAPHR